MSGDLREGMQAIGKWLCLHTDQDTVVTYNYCFASSVRWESSSILCRKAVQEHEGSWYRWWYPHQDCSISLWGDHMFSVCTLSMLLYEFNVALCYHTSKNCQLSYLLLQLNFYTWDDMRWLDLWHLLFILSYGWFFEVLKFHEFHGYWWLLKFKPSKNWLTKTLEWFISLDHFASG